ncbi:ROK family protein [Bacillus taeanensis]|uniref:Uncharacterized protein n=1 Tax=Bacillus taeanensis TaxID=273032 RepID=A0A366XRA8_9BACI|nr:hypothetical protein DS031_14125 [Bacillus taeanensis]
MGGGILINGELYIGSVSSAGEFGQMIVKKDGPLCDCDRRVSQLFRRDFFRNRDCQQYDRKSISK